VATGDDPALAAVVDTWPELPEAIKAGILAMVKAAAKDRRQSLKIEGPKDGRRKL
jgi:hypothetical protein